MAHGYWILVLLEGSFIEESRSQNLNRVAFSGSLDSVVDNCDVNSLSRREKDWILHVRIGDWRGFAQCKDFAMILCTNWSVILHFGGLAKPRSLRCGAVSPRPRFLGGPSLNNKFDFSLWLAPKLSDLSRKLSTIALYDEHQRRRPFILQN